MIGVDTNVLLRFVLRDDEEQFQLATAFLGARTADDPAFVSLLVVAEMAWALGQRYGFNRNEVRGLFQELLDTEELVFEERDALADLMAEAERGDIADHIIAYSARRHGCSATVTFDRAATKVVAGMELIA